MRILFFILFLFSQSYALYAVEYSNVVVGAERMHKYLPMLKGKNVAVIANQTSMVKDKHLVDALLEKGIKIKIVFSPEHGFRGLEDAGKVINNDTDVLTGLPIVSLYGANKKPSKDQLEGIDIVVFDIQDVGVRFYTYISTMHYAMEACAEKGIPFLVLDRPNPNGFFVDGPVLKKEYQSFVGIHPIPIVHGLTVGELAQMINGEKWLANGLQCDLKIVKVKKYNHKKLYELPVKPSPNLPNMTAILYYPTVGLLEGTSMSVGRGTEKPFQYVGHPELTDAYVSFTPKSMQGAQNPVWEGQECKGYDVNDNGIDYIVAKKGIGLACLLKAYQSCPKDDFFNDFFYKLSGNKELRMQLEFLEHEEAIRASWKPDLDAYKLMRKKYLLYDDFE